MKTLLYRALFALILIGTAASANANVWTLSSCSYEYDPGYVVGNWPNFTLFGPANLYTHVGDTSGCADFSIPIYSESSYTFYTATFQASRSISFDWSYHSGDPDGSVWDPAGYILNGVRHSLSVESLCYQGSAGCADLNQSGTQIVTIDAGSRFGFWVELWQNGNYRGSLTISDVHGVSEPGTVALLALGLIAIGATRLRRQ